MSSDSFSTSWKRSVQPRKQRTYRYRAPLHLQQKLLHVHLSPELRKKYGYRNIQLKTGDKVKVLRGRFRKQEGEVSRVLLKKGKVFVAGVERIKKDGTKYSFPLTPSALLITHLNLNDKQRKKKVEAKNTAGQPAASSAQKLSTPPPTRKK